MRSRPMLAAMWVLGTLSATGVSAQDLWTASSGTTTIALNRPYLARLGIGVVEEDPTAVPWEPEGLSLQEPGTMGFEVVGPSQVQFTANRGHFTALQSGVLRHRGGFVMHVRGGDVSLIDFVLRVEGDTSFALQDTAANDWFSVTSAMMLQGPGQRELHVIWMNLAIAPALAARLARPDLEDAVVGGVALNLRVVPTRLDAPGTVSDGTLLPCEVDFLSPNQNRDNDVALTVLETIGFVDRVGDTIGLSADATLRHVGHLRTPPARGAVRWVSYDSPGTESDFEGASNRAVHPFLVFDFYRLSQSTPTRLEQIGQSDAKNTHATTNSACVCILPAGNYARGHILFEGCEDKYPFNANRIQSVFVPRDQITASTADWEPLGSHLDPGATGQRTHAHPGTVDIDHLLAVPEALLDPPPSDYRYFMEGRYIVNNDVNIFNNMRHSEVTPTPAPGGDWSFPPVLDGGGMQVSDDDSILKEFVPQDTSTSARVRHDTGEGIVELAFAATDSGGGTFHYEFALMNHDFDRRVNAFTLPIPVGMNVQNVAFRDVDSEAANDWTAAIGTTAVSWQAPAGGANALDWGTLFNLSFDADAPPVISAPALGVSGTDPAGATLTGVFVGAGFSDAPLVVGETRARAVHISELRSRVNALRKRWALGDFAWSRQTLTAGMGIEAVDVIELRTALNHAYEAAPRMAPNYEDQDLRDGFRIRAVHIQDLRDAVEALE